MIDRPVADMANTPGLIWGLATYNQDLLSGDAGLFSLRYKRGGEIPDRRDTKVMQARDEHSPERPPWESRRGGRMLARLPPRTAFPTVLCIRDGCHEGWMVVRVLFPSKELNPHIFIYN